MVKGKNKKGWIRIAEAFMAILLVMGVLIIMVSDERIVGDEIDLRIQNAQIGILREIQINDTLRDRILDKNKLDNIVGNRTMQIDFLENCESEVCSVSKKCDLNNEKLEGKNIYVQSIMVTSTLDEFNPKILKLFCW